MPVAKGSPAGARIWWVAFLTAAAVLAAFAFPSSGRAALTPVIETTITAGPADESVIEGDSASFSFTATRDGLPFPDAVFRCSFDYAPVVECTSPLSLEELDEGPHRFSVFAEDPEHFTADPVPAQRSFVVAEEDEEGAECAEAFDEEAPSEEEACDADAGSSALPPQECVLRSARAKILADAEQGRIRLVIRYTAFAPADVTVDYRLSGARGALRLKSARRPLAERGVIHVDESLGAAEVERLRAARRFTVVLHVATTPRYCRRFDIRHLTIRRTAHDHVLWLQSDSIFGTRP